MTAEPVPSAPTLQLRAVPHPARPSEAVSFYADWQTACRHLQNHVLTAPECHAWALVDPQYRQILDAENSDARWRYCEQASASQGETAQPLYDFYCGAVTRDAQDAAVLTWHRSQGRLTVALGTSGILILVEDVVTTAFLPEQGDPQATRDSQQGPKDGGLPRERGMRTGRPGCRDGQVVAREERIRLQRETAWTRAQRLYYRVFKPAVQFVKRCHHRSRDMYGGLTRGDYALLKDALPHLSQFKYEDWAALRQQCGRDG
jgi:hypothetical protein